jgi:hypothetical protein
MTIIALAVCYGLVSIGAAVLNLVLTPAAARHLRSEPTAAAALPDPDGRITTG